MRYPKMILFDYGHTLLYEPGWDSVRGNAELLKYATKNPEYILRPIENEFGNLPKDREAVKTIEIHGANAYQTFSKTRAGCRGIVIKDSLMLISHEVNTEWYLIPGGGLEDGETCLCCNQRGEARRIFAGVYGTYRVFQDDEGLNQQYDYKWDERTPPDCKSQHGWKRNLPCCMPL